MCRVILMLLPLWMLLGCAHATRVDQEIQKMLREISPARIRVMDGKLASFGTRHTLSDTKSETRGVGAARNWIKSEFESFNKDGGKLQVALDEFMAPNGKRIPEPTPTANVIAILPGTMPEAAGRRYYVMGHYDSMPSPRYNKETDDGGW